MSSQGPGKGRRERLNLPGKHCSTGGPAGREPRRLEFPTLNLLPSSAGLPRTKSNRKAEGQGVQMGLQRAGQTKGGRELQTEGVNTDQG